MIEEVKCRFANNVKHMGHGHKHNACVNLTTYALTAAVILSHSACLSLAVTPPSLQKSLSHTCPTMTLSSSARKLAALLPFPFLSSQPFVAAGILLCLLQWGYPGFPGDSNLQFFQNEAELK